jgi:four helix bundle protein
MRVNIRSHRELKVFQAAMAVQKTVFLLSLQFPSHEQYDLTRQLRRSSRSTCASISEAWRKRRYEAHWVSKLTDAEQEAAESQVWAETARDCGYITADEFEELFADIEQVIGQLVLMEIHPEKWVTPYDRKRPR